MPASVCRDEEDACCQCADVNRLTVLHLARATGDASALSRVAENLERPVLEQVLVAADVVPMMVRGEDRNQINAGLPHLAQDRRGLSAVDYAGLMGVLVDDEISVVVGELRNRNDLHGRL